MTVQVRGRPLLTESREIRRTRGAGRRFFTQPQHDLFDSPYHLTVWWGANGIGKTWGLAELCRRALAGELHWQVGAVNTVLLTGRTWKQIGVTLGYLWDMIDRTWFHGRLRFEQGTLKGQRHAVFDVIAGPHKGSRLICAPYDAKNLAGPRAGVVISDEPIPEDVFTELWTRMIGRDGRIYIGFTPTLGTNANMAYLWAKIDDPKAPWAGEIQTPMSLAAVTPRGGLVEVPWMGQTEIDRMESGVSQIETDMRMGRSRTPRLDTCYFGCWDPARHWSTEEPPSGTPVCIGIDWGSKPGATRIVMSAVSGRAIQARVWVIAEYKSGPSDGMKEYARAAIAMCHLLDTDGNTSDFDALGVVDKWIGDRAHHGDFRGAVRTNERFRQAVAEALGHPRGLTGATAKLPAPLQSMRTPRKYFKSHYEGMDILHQLMSEDRIRVHTRCVHLREDIEQWQGSSADAHKDGLDGWRYPVVPMIEGRSH